MCVCKAITTKNVVIIIRPWRHIGVRHRRAATVSLWQCGMFYRGKWKVLQNALNSPPNSAIWWWWWWVVVKRVHLWCAFLDSKNDFLKVKSAEGRGGATYLLTLFVWLPFLYWKSFLFIMQNMFVCVCVEPCKRKCLRIWACCLAATTTV